VTRVVLTRRACLPAKLPTVDKRDKILTSTRQVERRTIALCAALLLGFAILAGTAAAGKSPTADESYHALAGWLHLWHDDYRFDTEDPPLWDTLAALAAGPHCITAQFAGDRWVNLPMDTRDEYQWQIHTLFRTAGNNADAFIGRFRLMMLAVAVGLGAMIGRSAWRLARAAGIAAGPAGVAAVVATALFALDPNFLAHGGLMKNDVACSLATLGLTMTAWTMGRRLSLPGVVAMGIWSGVALGTKFTGPVLLAITAMLLLLRAMLPWPWALQRGCTLRRRGGRVAAASVALAVGGIIAWGILWLSYGLHYLPGRHSWSHLNLEPAVQLCIQRSWQAHHTDGYTLPVPTDAQMQAAPQPVLVTAALWIDSHHLLPQAFTAGLLYTYQSALVRGEYLCGQVRCTGWWWYFPFAMAVKTPVATLAALGVAAMVGIWAIAGGRRISPTDRAERLCHGLPARLIQMHRPIRWSAICLTVPATVYLAVAMISNLNLGLRHVLPVYPLLYIAVGLAAAKMWGARRRLAIAVSAVLAIGLASETLAAYPNFIPFFNVLAGGSRGGLRLLSDSNLDWGQDLPLLASWQRANPNQKLYLAYFGTADPAYYGIRYTNLEEGYWAGPQPQPLTAPGVVAISATTLQGPYTRRLNGKPYYAGFWKLQPFEVLGGSIYLFHFPPASNEFQPPATRLIGNQPP
jgi:hypothetical protein